MAGATLTDRANIQGLAAFGYGKLTQAVYLLVRIRDSRAARGWLAETPVASAEVKPTAPENAMQIAFTADGLRKLGLRESIVRGFSREFLEGLTGNAGRSRRLGDSGASAPEQWSGGRRRRRPMR